MRRLLALVLSVPMLLAAAGCGRSIDIPIPENTQPLAAYALAEAVYPEMAPMPNLDEYLDPATGEMDYESYDQLYEKWWEDQQARFLPEGYPEDMTPFLTRSIPQFLSGAEGKNVVYSPLNVYLALGMLAELTNGSSRQQILDLLGSESMESLRKQASLLWKTNYCDDGASTTILASSLWLDENTPFVQPTLDKLAEIYYASAYRGEMGSAAFNEALRSWLNRQTGGLLEEQISQIELDAQTILALATTISFRAKWSSEFDEGSTQPRTFHAADGDMTCDFMYQGGTDSYYWGETFSAVQKNFEGRESMWFFLPDEGCTPEDLLTDPQMAALLQSPYEWENNKFLIVNKYIPKFDVVSQMDLVPDLQALGITDVFDSSQSDFTPMTDARDDIFLSQVKHDARVTVDEEGCTAVAYTVMAMCGSAMPPDEEVDFVLDRPFLFVITGCDGLPLFVGIVNQPS